MTLLAFTTSILQTVLQAMTVGLGLAAALAVTPAAVAQLTPLEPTRPEAESTEAASPESITAIEVGSEALVTQPAQVSLSDLVDSPPDAISVEERPTLVFTLGDRVTTPREQIQENKPENANAIHFPLEN
ncbi:MAG: hypothetical protein WBA10_10265 [Elainellaceae cyanobacterium]